MYVKDYEFISNIDALFEKTIAIYGAGDFGIRMANLLKDMSVPFDCFCDKDTSRKEVFSHPIITREDLKRKTESEACLIIVASKDYYEEIIEELQECEIDACVCTWYGIWLGIELNIEDKRLPKKFSEDFVRRKKIWEDRFEKNWQKICYFYHMRLCEFPHAIWVYQPGKVGSSSIVATLEREKILNLQIHYLLHSVGYVRGAQKVLEECSDDVVGLLPPTDGPVKIIVNVREPVGRALSEFMHGFGERKFIVYCENNNLPENAYRCMKMELESDYLYGWWFDHELKAVTGIDVYEHQFDKRRGYALIKENGFEILLLKMEQMNENKDIIGEFIGRPNLKLIKDNAGSMKRSRYIYEGLKSELQLPKELIERAYQNERYQHFYTEEETEKFMRKWLSGYGEKANVC